MNDSPKIPVLLAPALTVDHALSMDLYLTNLKSALAPFADRFDFEVITAPTSRADGWPTKQWARYVVYPRVLNTRLRERPGAVLHVLDHSYGHLCRTDVPSVVTCHGLENFRLKLTLFWQQALWVYRVRGMRRARRIVAISRDAANDIQRFVGADPAKVSVNYHGIEPIFNPDGGTTPELDALRASGDLLVLHVGTNYPRKNVGLLLDALARLRAQGLPVRFVKVGSDPREDGYRSQLERLGLASHFHYLGWLDKPALASVYRSCQVLAFPSTHEGFGRPIIEAQACGLPIVIADTTSAREISGSAALLHALDDAGDLAGKIQTAATDPEVRAGLSAGGLENVRRFSWAEHARVLTEIYGQLYGAAVPASK